MSALQCDLRVLRGEFVLDASFDVAAGEVVGLIGPNGAGKSTVLDAIAGALPLHNGRIQLFEQVLTDRRLTVQRSARRVGYLDQRARFFPHLDAAANIAFGPKSQRGRFTSSEAEQWLERVGLPGRGSARAHELSGGQQQRVAIARTLAADPRALLLDEPFSALDVTSAGQLRALLKSEIRRLEVPTLLVTHDPVDLIALADRVIVLEEGRIAHSGSVASVLTTPRSAFAAEFAGRVLLRGTASDRGTLLVDDAPVAEIFGSGELPAAGEAALASFDPSELRILPNGAFTEDDTSRMRWSGSIALLAATRSGVRVDCDTWPGVYAEIPVSRVAGNELPQAEVTFELSAAAVTFSAAASSD